MLKKNDPNRKNRRKKTKRQKIKAKVKNTDLASYFQDDDNGRPLFKFSPEIKAIFKKGIEKLIEQGKEQENK